MLYLVVKISNGPNGKFSECATQGTC